MKNSTPLSSSTLAALAVAPLVFGLPTDSADLAKRAGDTTSISLNTCSGTPQLFAQGILYGLSTDPNSPPQSYLDDLKINYEAAGGAQTSPSPGGYAVNFNDYKYRFSTAVTAWKRIRARNGVFALKMADLWGADETTGNNFPFPGDNGDFSQWAAFLQQVINDVKANGMANSYTTQLECWNEPDINFGGRPQSQFNQAFVQCIKTLRQAFPKSGTFLPVNGPATASRPDPSNGWWQSMASYMQANGGTAAQPDVWTWHLEENNNNDPIYSSQYLNSWLPQYGLNNGIGYQISEYSIRSQQVPSWQAWYKARFQRVGFNGLRGNWASGSQLNDLMAQLLIKNSDGSYSTTGDYQTWSYYAKMTNSPCSTTSGNSVDAYATAGSGNATALIGSQGYTGTVNVAFNSVSSQFGTATSLKGTLYRIPYNNGGAVNGWTVAQTLTVPVSSNTATVTFNADNANDAWAIRLTK